MAQSRLIVDSYLDMRCLGCHQSRNGREQTQFRYVPILNYVEEDCAKRLENIIVSYNVQQWVNVKHIDSGIRCDSVVHLCGYGVRWMLVPSQ
jgi:hypothetical protein